MNSHALQLILYLALLSIGIEANTAQSKTPPLNTKFLRAFPGSSEALPKGYRGVDANNFIDLFKSRTEKLERGQFEKTEEFIKRTSDLKSILAPISLEEYYAFATDNVAVAYNADAETITVRLYGSCQDGTRTDGVQGYITCRLSPLTERSRSYVASNSYGAQTKVTRFEGTYFGVTIKPGSSIIDGYKGEKYSTHKWIEVHDTLSMPLQKAKGLDLRGVAALFVGRVVGKELVLGPLTDSIPTFDFPFGNKRQTFAIPFEVSELVFYIRATGEILHRKIATPD